MMEQADSNSQHILERWKDIDLLVFEKQKSFINLTWDDLSSEEKNIRLVKKHAHDNFLEPKSVISSLKWDSNLDESDVENYCRVLSNNIHDTLNEVVHTSSFFIDLSRKLVIIKHFYDAHIEQLKPKLEMKSNSGTSNVEQATSALASVKISSVNPLDSLAQVGCRFGMSFVFSFLRKAWRSGEDSDLCTELLEDTLMALVSLPPMSLFNQPLTPTWSEVLKRSVAFLKTISVSSSDAGGASISEKDCQLGLRIILEVSLQRGSLSYFLDSILFLLNLSDKRKQAADVSKSTEMRGASLTSFLSQVKSITDMVLADNVPDKEKNASNFHIKTKASEIAEDPNELLLKHVKLPDNDSVLIDLKQAAMISLAFVNSLVLRMIKQHEEDEYKEKENLQFQKMMLTDKKKQEKWMEERNSANNYMMDNWSKKFRRKQKELKQLKAEETNSGEKKEEGESSKKKSATDLPLACDLQEQTFVILEAILQKVVCVSDNSWHPSQEQECMTVAILNITTLQLIKALKLDEGRLKEVTSWKVMSKIRNILLDLVTNPVVIDSVRKAAQRCLTFGGCVLLPTVSDLVESLLTFLSKDVAVEKENNNENYDNDCKTFLPKLLSKSIRKSHDFVDYLRAAVKCEEQSLQKCGGDVSGVSCENEQVIKLFTQIFKNILREKKRLIERAENINLSVHDKLLSRFIVFLTSSLLCSQHVGESKALVSFFRKFLVMLCEFHCDTIDAIVEKLKSKKVVFKVRRNRAKYILVELMKSDGTVALLSSMVTSMLLLQSQDNKVHFSLELDDYKLLIKTLQKFEIFVRTFSTKCLLIHDMDNLAWPGVYTVPVKEKRDVEECDARILREDEIENHNIEGGRWIVKDGCVYDEVKQSAEGEDSCELMYIGDYLPPDKDIARSTDAHDLKYCLLEILELQCTLAIIISSGLKNIYTNAGVMTFPINFQSHLSSKLFAGGKQIDDINTNYLKGIHGRSSIPYSMSRQNPEERMFLRALLDDVLEKETASVNLPDLPSMREGEMSCDAVNAAKLFVAYIDKVNKKNQITAKFIQQMHSLHQFGRFLLMTLLKHHDLVNCAMTFAMHHERGAKLPPAIQELLVSITQAQTNVIHMHQTTRRPYEEICEAAIDRLNLLMSLNPATPNPFLEPMADEMLRPIGRWKSTVLKMIQQIKKKKIVLKLTEEEERRKGSLNEDGVKLRSVSCESKRSEAAKMIWKEKCEDLKSLLLDVSLDPKKRKKLAIRMNGKISRRFDRSLSTSIISFALTEEFSSNDLSQLDKVLLNCHASVDKSIEAAQLWKSLMQDDYQTMSVKYCFMLGWVDFIMAIQKKDKTNCVEPENESPSNTKKKLKTNCCIKLDLTRTKSLEVFKFKVCQNQLAECVTGFLADLLTTDKLLLAKDQFKCSRRLFRRNISLDVDNNPLCRKLDDAYNISVTTRFFLLFVRLLHSSDFPHLLSHVWANGSHALLHHLATTLNTALPQHVMERIKDGSSGETVKADSLKTEAKTTVEQPAQSSSLEVEATTEPSTPVEYWHDFINPSDVSTNFGNEQQDVLGANHVSVTTDDNGGLLWKTAHSHHPIASMIYTTSWLLQDLYLKSFTNFHDVSFVRCLSGKLCDLIRNKYIAQENPLTVSEPLFPWTTLQFLSMLVKHSSFWTNSNIKSWICLLKTFIGNDLGSLCAVNLLDRLTALKIFNNILNHADERYIANLSECPVNYLFTILGLLLWKQTKLHGREESILNDNLLIPSNGESVASHVIDCIRSLHNTLTWQNSINDNISTGLHFLTQKCQSINTATKQDEQSDDFSFILASLAVLGFSCDLMHIGQTVHHKGWSHGVITEISQKEKVTAYFKSLKETRNCQVKNLDICCEPNNVYLLFPWSHTTEQAIVGALKLVLYSSIMSDKNNSNNLIDNVATGNSNDNHYNQFMSTGEIEKLQLFVMLLRTLPTLFRNKALIKGILNCQKSLVNSETPPSYQPMTELDWEQTTNDVNVVKVDVDSASKTSVSSSDSLETKSEELVQEVIKEAEEEEDQFENNKEELKKEVATPSSSLASIESLQPNIVSDESKVTEDEVKQSEGDSESFVSTTSDQVNVEFIGASGGSLQEICYPDDLSETSESSMVPYYCSSSDSFNKENIQIPFPSYTDDNIEITENIIQELLSFATKPSSLKTEFSSEEKEDAFLVLLDALGSTETSQKLDNLIMDKFNCEQAIALKDRKQSSRKSRRSRTERRQRHVQQIKFNEACHDVEPRRANRRNNRLGRPPTVLGMLARTYVDRLKPKPKPPSSEKRQLLEMGFSEGAIHKAYTELQKSTSTSLLPLWGDDSNSNPSLQEVISWLLEHPDQLNISTSTPADSEDEFTLLEPSTADSIHSSSSSTESSSDSLSDSSSIAVCSALPPSFKSLHDFVSSGEYAEYVRRNIMVGMNVVCCRPYEEVKKGFTGQVVGLDHDGLHDLNVQVYWDQKSGTYWVRYVHIQLKNKSIASSPDDCKATISTGDKIRVKRSVVTPKYKWGQVTPSSVGIVTSFQANGRDAVVKFREQPRWIAPVNELELVPVIHDNVKCTGCQTCPIEGYRYKCSLCADFDMCSKCFFTTCHATPRHVFNIIEAPGDSPRPLGPSGDVQKKSPRMAWETDSDDVEETFLTQCSSRPTLLLRKHAKHSSQVLRNHKQLVDIVIASSSSQMVKYLWDGSNGTCWKSNGVAGEHLLNIHMKPGSVITKMVMQVNPEDSSYMPSSLVVSLINPDKMIYDDIPIHVQPTAKHVMLLEDCTIHFDVIDIRIKQCRNAGINCKIRGLEIQGYIDSDLIPNQSEKAKIKHFYTTAASYLSEESFYAHESLSPQRSTRHKRAHLQHCNKHSLLKTKAWVWGLNDKDQLSGPRESKVKTPVFSEAISRLKVHQIIGGSKSLFVVTVEGKVYSCGESGKGRLGHGSLSSNVSTLTQITSLSSHVIKKVAVHSGGCHCLAMTLQGRVFSWGDGDDGKLGHSTRADCLKPRLIEALKAHEVVDIACGSAHSAAVTSNGILFTWGQGTYGRLGHGNNNSLLKPKGIRQLRYKIVVKVACGSRDAQTLCLTDDGFVYSWGDGDFGKLGRGGSNGCSVPLIITKLEGQDITQIECGAQFSLALSRDGKVWTWGKGDYFRLGHGTDEHVRKPQLIPELKDKKIVNVAVGALHCLVVTDKGEVYSWGDNDHGQQGNGTTAVNRKPSLIMPLCNLNITNVACGSSHSVAWSISKETEILLQPILFKETTNKLGVGLVDENDQKPSDHDGDEKDSSSHTTLQSTLLLLHSKQEKKTALHHVLQSLQVDFARSVIGQLLSHDKVETMNYQPVNEPIDNMSSASSCISEHTTSQEQQETTQEPPQEIQAGLLEQMKISTKESNEDEEDKPGCSYSAPVIAQPYSSQSNVLPVHSDPAMVSLIAETITRPEEIVIPTPKKRDRSSSSEDKALIDVVLEHLTPKDATKITNLLRLILHGKIDNSNVDGLKEALRSMILKDQQVCDVLLEECIFELEEIVQTAQSLASKIRPIVEESRHPYPDDIDVSGKIKIQGASHLSVIFDRQCSTEPDHDILTIYKGDENKPIASLSGRDWSSWSNVLHVEGNEIRWRFKSDASVNGWGWKFTVHPTTAIGCDKNQNSQNCPLLQFVSTVLSVFFPHGQPPMTALVSCMTKSKKDLVSQLVQWLSSCMQVTLFGTKQRMWALQQLRCLLDCCVLADGGLGTITFTSIEQKQKPHHNKHTAIAFFNSFIKVLPDILLCQYNYEAPDIQCGKQLMHSNYMKELASLACDMHLELMISAKDRQRISLLMQFFMAARTLKAFVKRTLFPANFLRDVSDKLESMHVDEDVYCDTTSISHEDNRAFTVDMDKQLVQWINKRPDDWSNMWGGSRQIFGWGHNHRGQLGGIDGAKIKVPTQCSTLSSLRPVLLVGGEQTLYIVTADGKVYATGYGASGRLGIGTNESITVPTLLESIQHVHITSLAVNSGGKHILALSSDGEVYSWGEGAEGKLGHGTRTSCDRPRIIESLRGVHIVAIAAGGAHSAAIAKSGELYTWGKGRYGRLGHGDSEDRLKPKLVEALKGYHVIDVSCGNGDAQTLCLTKTDDQSSAKLKTLVWSWGDGDYGKLGRDGSDGCKIPMQIPALQGRQIISVKCGSQFSLALSKIGLVYTWGKGDYFRLGHNSDQHVRLPKVIEALRGKKVIAVSTGSLHCVVCTSDGAVFTWGDNDEGQLGDGSLNAAKEPREIEILHGKSVNRVACGSAHSIAWSTGQNQPTNSDHNDFPDEVPMEFNHLQTVSMPVLRNRLVLLNYFSEIFCPWISLIKFSNPTSQSDHDIASSLDSRRTQLESDVLRSLLVTSGKECVFKKVVQSTMQRDKQHGPVIELNRIQGKRQKAAGLLTDHSKAVFTQVQARMTSLIPENILLPHRVWKVKFVGESVDDCGGGYSESVAEMCEELQNGSLPLLIPTPNALDEAGANRDCFLLTPVPKDKITNQQSDMFKFLGILFGIAIRTGSPLSLNIAEPVWKQLSNMSPTLQDIPEVDKEFLPRLMFIRDADEDTLESMMLPFTIKSSTGIDISLSTKHEYVTMRNKNEYIRLSLNYRLHEFDHVISVVRDGMSKVIPLPLLILFTPQEVQTMVCGNPTIPLTLLKSVASFKGTVTDDNIPKWFWEIMENMTNEERSLFLRFVWGRTRLPRTIADFRGRDFVVQILDKYNPPDYYLPESYTCFFLLKLPRYSCKHVLEQKLKYAIHFCKSIDTDEYARLAMNDGDGDDDFDEDSAAIITTAEQLMRRHDREAEELLRPLNLHSRSIGSMLANRVRSFLRDPLFDDDFLSRPLPDVMAESSTSGPDSSTDDNDDFLPII